MYRFTSTKLVLIQEITNAVHTHFHIEFSPSALTQGQKKFNSMVRAISVGFCSVNLDASNIEIAASLTLSLVQTETAINNFNRMFSSISKTKELNDLWTSILDDNISIKFNIIDELKE